MKSKSFKSWVGAFVLAMTAFGALALVPSHFGGTDTADAKGKPGALQAAVVFSLNDTDPQLNDVVTFTYAGVTNDCGKNYGPRCLRVELVCSQSGTPVYLGDANADQQFLLGGGTSQWVTNGGPAECAATLYYYSSYNPVTRVNVAATSFPAGG